MIESYVLDAELCVDPWSQFFNDHYESGLAFAHWRVGNIEDARDVVQDCVVRILRLLPDPNWIGDQRNYWLKTIQHRSYELLRKRNVEAARTVSRDIPTRNGDGEELLPPDPVDPNRDPEMNALINEENERLLRALEMRCADLTPHERNLLALRFAAYTNEEIASMWGEEVNVIRADMNAVVAKIRYRLQHERK